LAAHFAKRNTKFGGGKIGIGKRGRAVSAVPPTAGAISRSFVPSVALWALAGRQKRFELRSAIATNQDISNFQGKEFALPASLDKSQKN